MFEFGEYCTCHRHFRLGMLLTAASSLLADEIWANQSGSSS